MMAATNLTSQFCESVKPVPKRQMEYPDAKIRGLALRVSGDGRKVWTYRYRNAAGKQCRLTLGVHTSVFGLAEARVKAARLRSSVDDGKDPASERRVEKAREQTRTLRTFDDLAQAYFTACELGQWTPRSKVKRKRSLDDERGVYKRHIEKHLGGIPVEEVSRAVVRKRLRAMVAAGIGAQTNKAHQMIRGAFSYAVGEELEPQRILFNPAMGFGAVAQVKPRARVLTDDELKACWTVLTDEAVIKSEDKPIYVGPHMRLAIRLCALLLQRKNEVIGMRLSEIDRRQALWRIPADRMKGGREHLVPLPPEALRLIEQAIALNADRKLANDGPVFPSPRDPVKSMRPDSVSHAMAAITSSLGIKDATPHDLRRTGASALTSERLGISPLIRSKILGHSSDSGGGAAVSSAHYDANNYLAEKRRGLEAWETLLLTIVGERVTASNSEMPETT